MANIDIIEAAVKAYHQVWRERAYLWKLALVPILIKIVCEITVLSLGWADEYIKQALIMLPSYMAEGWMMAHFVRLIFLDHRWPFHPSGNFDDDIKQLQIRARGVMGGMISYTLVKMALVGFVAISYGSLENIENMDGAVTSGTSAANEPTALMFLASVALMLLFIWAFRFLWIFVPVSLNYPIRDYVRNMGGFMSSVWLVGVWLVCFFPPFFVTGMIATVLFSGMDSDTASTQFLFSIIRALVDILISLITVAGICRVLAGIIGSSDKDAPTPRA